MTVTDSLSANRLTENHQQLVLRLTREIEELANSQATPSQFFPLFLERVLKATMAPAGAVWLLGDREFQLACEFKLDSIGMNEGLARQQAHLRLLADVASNLQTRAVHTDDESGLSLPGRHLLILAAVQAGGACRAVVEIFHRPDVPVAARGGYLQFIEQMAGYASRFLERNRKPPSAASAASSVESLIGFGLQLQRSLRVSEVSVVAVNEGRALLGCDRVSLLVQRGRKVLLQAVSGQKSVHHGANLVRSVRNLAREVIQSGLPVIFNGSMDSFAPQVEERIADFIQEGGARAVYALPLRESARLGEAVETEHKAARQGRVFGCLVLEYFSESEPEPESLKQTDWLLAYISAALHSALTYESLFLLPVWRGLGRISEWLRGRGFLKAVAAAITLAALLTVLILVKVDFRVHAKGRLMPVIKQEVFVPLDSEVVEVAVASGQHVEPGDLLVQLRSNDLQTELLGTRTQLQEKRKLHGTLLAERDEASRSELKERAYRIDGDLAKTQIEVHGLELQLHALEERLSLLKVTSTIAGVVSTFDVDQLLRHRPVRRGEVLMEIMNESGPWELELEVAEHRMGHVLNAQSQSSSTLAADYLLMTSPERSFPAELKQIGTHTIVSSDGLPVVTIRAGLPEQIEHSRRIGAEVRARLYCGRSSLGYVLFGDFIEFIQRTLWL